MAYVKPYTYVNGTALDGSSQEDNDEAARIAINQKTFLADIEDNSFDYDDISRGEYEPITRSHQFTSGDFIGLFTDAQVLDRSYFTSETKANDQTTSVQYQDIYNTGNRFILEESGAFFINFGGAFASNENILATSAPFNDGSHPGRGQWDSQVYLRIHNETTNITDIIAGTIAYTYEETSSASAGVTNPGAGGVTARRWIGWQWLVTNQTAGAYSISVVINPKVESGYAGARQFTCETFYI